MDLELRHAAQQIAVQRQITQEQAEEIVLAAAPLWRALEPLVDGYGGSEFCRVFPEAIEAIHRLANPLAHDLEI